MRPAFVRNNMEQWTIAFFFISVELQHIFQDSQASQPPEYIGCYPNYVAELVNEFLTSFNNGGFCIGICKSFGYRYAATKGEVCKCANETTLDMTDDAECDLLCPKRLLEHCGGTNSVSLYDTLLPTILDYPGCVKDPYGSQALKGDVSRHIITIRYDNSVTLCTALCEALRYIFSGTKVQLCICGDRIKDGIEVSTKCQTKCPGNGEEICGGNDTVSLRRTGYVTPWILSRTTLSPSTTATQTHLMEVNVTNESTGNASAISTQPSINVVISKAYTSAIVAKWFQITATFLLLPCGCLIAGMLLRGCKRRRSESRVKRREISSFHFKVEQRENTMPDDDHYQTIDPEFRQYVDNSTYRTTAVDICDAGYITPVDFNDTAGYITPVEDSNDNVDYITPVD